MNLKSFSISCKRQFQLMNGTLGLPWSVLLTFQDVLGVFLLRLLSVLKYDHYQSLSCNEFIIFLNQLQLRLCV